MIAPSGRREPVPDLAALVAQAVGARPAPRHRTRAA
jgi:hypothetical protein